MKQIDFFEKYLTLWVALCILSGILIGKIIPESIQSLSSISYAGINIPITILIWAMIFPMMMQIDFGAIRQSGQNLKGLGITVSVNWLIKPFTMAFFAWLFFRIIYQSLLEENLASEYIAGAILLGAAPCTAMVFVWSYLSDGDANYTLVQVAVNDLIILVAFIPIVQFLLGIQAVIIPFDTLLFSVIAFVLIPLIFGALANHYLKKKLGEESFKIQVLNRLKPISIIALLLTLVIIFAYQGDVILNQPLNILLIAIPLAIQTFFIFFLAWGLGKTLKLPHKICAPASMIGASNFFELAVAVAIALFGINNGAVLVTVVGVLIEVPIMLSLVKLAQKWKY